MGMLLKVKKSQLEGTLANINTRLDNLSNIKSRYETLLTRLDQEVVESTDDNYARVEAMVLDSIAAVKKEIEAAQAARQSIEEAIKSMDEFSGNVQTTINTVLNSVEPTIKAASSVLSVASKL